MSTETIPHAKELFGDASTQLFINQLLLSLVIQRGGTVEVPVAEIDATGGHMLTLMISNERGMVTLRASKKH